MNISRSSIVINNYFFVSQITVKIRIIHEEESNEIYQTPAIMAVLDFKWSAARQYFIRHIMLSYGPIFGMKFYILYVLYII